MKSLIEMVTFAALFSLEVSAHASGRAGSVPFAGELRRVHKTSEGAYLLELIGSPVVFYVAKPSEEETSAIDRALAEHTSLLLEIEPGGSSNVGPRRVVHLGRKP